MTRLRIEAAKRMLRNDDMSVKRIAREAGFATRANMYKCFRETLGMSPSEFRSNDTEPAA